MIGSCGSNARAIWQNLFQHEEPSMTTRRIGSLGAMTLVLAVGSVAVSTQSGQTQEKKVSHMEHSAALQACAEACSNCQRSCDSCATHCAHLLADGKKDHLGTLNSCQDCATICAAASRIVARGGPYSALICDACAKACAQCAAACDKFADDKHMAACAAECRKCEKACKAMLAHLGGK
jgi:hypothetical protein